MKAITTLPHLNLACSHVLCQCPFLPSHLCSTTSTCYLNCLIYTPSHPPATSTTSLSLTSSINHSSKSYNFFSFLFIFMEDRLRYRMVHHEKSFHYDPTFVLLHFTSFGMSVLDEKKFGTIRLSSHL